jgi:hypothetical protein
MITTAMSQFDVWNNDGFVPHQASQCDMPDGEMADPMAKSRGSRDSVLRAREFIAGS